jgi:hypothetical protein
MGTVLVVNRTTSNQDLPGQTKIFQDRRRSLDAFRVAERL